MFFFAKTIPSQLVKVPRAKTGGVPFYSIPGVECCRTGSESEVLDANFVRYYPFLTQHPITIDELCVYVMTAAAGKKIRLGIYNCDLDCQPTSLVLDAGEVTTDTVGKKTISLNQYLPAGRYLLALNTNGTPSLAVSRGGGLLLGYRLEPNALCIVKITQSYTYAPFPTTGVVWASLVIGQLGFGNQVFMRIKEL